jgi:ABC-type iron transport system FetAB ATPase subunit
MPPVKTAALKDNWKHVTERQHPFRISSISVQGIRGVGNLNTQVDSGSLLAICGSNGSGKTTLLRCIHACIGGEIEGGPLGYSAPDLTSLSEGTVRVGITYNGTTEVAEYCAVDGSSARSELGDVYYFEPSASAPSVMKCLREAPDLGELVEASGFRDVDPDLYTYAVGRDYSAVRVSEVEIGSGIAPHFEVDCNGVKYYSHDMGLGEFAIFHLIWLLEYVPRNSLVLIEEPEAFISPRSQVAVADVIAKFTDEKRLFTVFTTHSPQVLSRTPVSAMRILVRLGSSCELISASGRDEYCAVLGITRPPSGIVFVEDLAAQHMTQAALREFAPSLLTRLSVVRLSGDTTVITTLAGIPRLGHPLYFVGLLDGDSADKGFKSDWPLRFLPGDRAPDAHMLEATIKDLETFSHCLGIDIGTVKLYASSLAGCDPHDWPHEFARSSGANLQSVFEAMGSCWARSDEWDESGRGLCVELAEIFDDERT